MTPKTPAKRAGKPAERRGGKRSSVTPPKAKRKPTATVKRKAKTAVERAKRAGAIGPHGTDAQRALRDGAVIAALAAGDSVSMVGKEFGIANRTVEEIRKKRASLPSIFDEPPMEILEERAAALRVRISAFDRFAHKHADANPSVAVAAMKGAVAAEGGLDELLYAVGQLPDDLQMVRAEAELRSIALEMVEVVGKLVDGEIDAAEVAVFFRSIADDRSQRRQQALPR